MGQRFASRVVGLLAGVAAIAGIPQAASAAVVTYTDRAQWQAAVGSYTETDADAHGGNLLSTVLLGGGASLSFFGFALPWDWDVTEYEGTTPGGEIILFGMMGPPGGSVFGAPAFGLYLFHNDPNLTLDVILTLGDGSSITQTLAPRKYLFYGWVGADPEEATGFSVSAYDAITHTVPNVWVGTTEIFVAGYGTPAQLPEPASLALLGLGMLGLTALRRRNKA